MGSIKKEFRSDSYTVTFSISDEDEGQRLDQFIQKYFTSFSREYVKQKIAKKEILIVDKTSKLKPSTKVHAGEVVIAKTFKGANEDEYWNGEKLNLQLVPEMIFEDENLIICSKPAFMTTHPTGKHLFNCVSIYFESLGYEKIFSIHRLDRETSGILSMSKNAKTAKEIGRQFEDGKVKKVYFLIIKRFQKSFTPFPFTANQRLGFQDISKRIMKIDHYPENSSLGKSAKTKFLELHSERNYTLALAFPMTGRQHQIRIHAAAHGHPLLGDKLYNSDEEIFSRFKDKIPTNEDHQILEIPRHALHSIAINFNYNSKHRSFISRIPKDLLQWINKNLKCDIDKIEAKIRYEIDNYFENND